MQLKWGAKCSTRSDASWPNPQSFVGAPLDELPLRLKNSTIGQRSALVLWSGQPHYFREWLLRSPARWAAAPSEAVRSSGSVTVLQLPVGSVLAPGMGQGGAGLSLWLLGHIKGEKLKSWASRHLTILGLQKRLYLNPRFIHSSFSAHTNLMKYMLPLPALCWSDNCGPERPSSLS